MSGNRTGLSVEVLAHCLDARPLCSLSTINIYLLYRSNLTVCQWNKYYICPLVRQLFHEDLSPFSFLCVDCFYCDCFFSWSDHSLKITTYRSLHWSSGSVVNMKTFCSCFGYKVLEFTTNASVSNKSNYKINSLSLYWSDQCFFRRWTLFILTSGSSKGLPRTEVQSAFNY